MADNKIVEHPSALLGIGREAVRERDIFKAVEVLLELTPPDSGLDIPLGAAVDRNLDITEDEKVIRTANALLSLRAEDGWEAAIAFARRVAEGVPDKSFGAAVLKEIERQREAEAASSKD